MMNSRLLDESESNVKCPRRLPDKTSDDLAELVLPSRRSGTDDGDVATAAALADVFERDYEHLRRSAARMLYDHDLAEQIVMDAFYNVLTRLEGLKAEGLPAYIRRCVINGAHTAGRRRAIEQRLNQVTFSRNSAAVQPSPEGAIQYEPVTVAVSRLPARQRTTVVLRYYLDLPESDIAALLQCSVGTVKSQLHKAKSALAETLAEYRPGRVGPHSRRRTHPLAAPKYATAVGHPTSSIAMPTAEHRSAPAFRTARAHRHAAVTQPRCGR